MIVSHSHELVFLKPRKVAGTSFEIALSKYLGSRDIITPINKDEMIRRELGYRSAQNYRKSPADILADRDPEDLRLLAGFQWPKKFYNHISAREVRDKIGRETWDRYTKVSIVRNPWDYIISYFYFKNRKDPDVSRFENWCLENRHIFQRNNGIYMIDGEIVVDKFIRYENLEAGIRSLEEAKPGLAGLWETFSSIKAKGANRPKRGASVQEIFERYPRVDALVSELCAFEIERFGYSKT
jgi:hypothetical protein